MLLPQLLTSSAERFPDKPALIYASGQMTFGELESQSRQVAARLHKLGIGRGDRVAILHENAPTAVVFFWGILKSGAQVVDIPHLAGTSTIEGIVRECKPAALVASGTQLRRLQEANANIIPRIVMTNRTTDVEGLACHALDEIVAVERSQCSLPDVRESDVGLIMYTSGTTGLPKGVMLSHRNLISNIQAGSKVMGLRSQDSILLVVPLNFIHGRMQLLTHALIGGTLALSAGFHFPQQVVSELARYQVTGFSGVPYHFSMLLDRSDFAKTSLPHLRYLLITGGAPSAAMVQNLSQAKPNVEIHTAYGQTESSPRISHMGPSELLSQSSSVGSPAGTPLPGIRLEIVDDDGSSVPAGEMGEIAVSGPNVMCGYVSGDESTSGKIDAFGRLRTGDLGMISNDGCLYIVGRKSELIKSAGERIFPREIENVLHLNPAVRECAVFGIPDDTLGEKIVACIVPQPGFKIDAAQIREHCLKHLPFVRVPRQFRIVSELQKTGSGKIDRTALAAPFTEVGLRARIA